MATPPVDLTGGFVFVTLSCVSTTQFNKSVAANMLGDDSTFATCLVSLAMDLYGDEAFSEDSLVVMKNMEDDLGGTFCEENENKLNAALAAATTDLFHRNPNVFNKIVLALNDGDIGDVDDPDDDDLDACKILWAITEVNLLTGDTYESCQEKMSDEVVALINSVVDNEAADLSEVPDDVDTMNEALTTPYYKQYVVAQVLAMATQLLKLGVNKATVAEMLAAHNKDISDTQPE